MADVVVRSTINLLVAKNPSVAGSPITEEDFKLAQTYEFATSSETQSSRFKIPAVTADVVISMGSVALGKMLIIIPESDIKVKIINGAGTTQDIDIKAGGLPTILNGEFTGLKISNAAATEAKGRIFVLGD